MLLSDAVTTGGEMLVPDVNVPSGEPEYWRVLEGVVNIGGTKPSSAFGARTLRKL